MSQGDTHFGIPTIYKGIKMRSKFETNIALMLDRLNIKWEYEPKSFLLSSGIYYIPDFYLTDLKIWLEVKGVIMNNNIEISKTFVEDNKTTLILWNYNDWFWFSFKDGDYADCAYEDNRCNYEQGIQIGLCSKCKSYFFTSLYGNWYCRNCKNHEGDHDILGWLSNEIGFKDNINLDEIIRRNHIKL